MNRCIREPYPPDGGWCERCTGSYKAVVAFFDKGAGGTTDVAARLHHIVNLIIPFIKGSTITTNDLGVHGFFDHSIVRQ
jgi:hypothetical protein